MLDRPENAPAPASELDIDLTNRAHLQEFARRRVDHLREKVQTGDINPQQLQKRLASRYGKIARDIVGEDGTIDFEQLQTLITTQQVTKLQDRLEGWFGKDANGIVGPDGNIDSEKYNVLHVEENVDRLLEKLVERFGDRANGIVSDEGTINALALRELFAYQDDEQPYEPAALRHKDPEMAVTIEPQIALRA